MTGRCALLCVVLGACSTGVPPIAPPVRRSHVRCDGPRIAIAASLELRACERRCGPDPTLPERLDAHLELTSSRVPAGGAIQARLVYRNHSDRPAELPFIWHAGPMFEIHATDAAGVPAGEPKGLPPGGPMMRPGPPYPLCLTLPPGGEAYVERGWRAVRWRWSRQRSAPGHPEREIDGPLPPGRYQLTLRSMLQVALRAPSATIEVTR